MQHDTNDTSDFSAWIGRTEANEDFIAPAPARQAAVTLGHDPAAFREGTALPALWHWFHFPLLTPQALLAEDGHEQRGAFMPPVPLPRRMFAGARMRFLAPLRIGAPARLERTIRSIADKTGRTGRLVFTTVVVRITQGGATCIEEEQDIVYRGHGEPVPAPAVLPQEPLPEGGFGAEVVADAALLFRFSALTWNAHRIHLDRDWCRDVEGYPGLIVHGPLQAVLLAGLAEARAGGALAGFEFRSEAPIFDLAPFHLRGTPADGGFDLETRRSDGVIAMRARARRV